MANKENIKKIIKPNDIQSVIINEVFPDKSPEKTPLGKYGFPSIQLSFTEEEIAVEGDLIYKVTDILAKNIPKFADRILENKKYGKISQIVVYQDYISLLYRELSGMYCTIKIDYS